MRQSQITLLLGVLLFCGCQWSPFSARVPVRAQQQYAATVNDPYPNTQDAPEIVGGRPREFDQPYAEARRVQPDRWIRARWAPWNWFGN